METPHFQNGPDRVEAQTEQGLFTLENSGTETWAGHGVEVACGAGGYGTDVHVAAPSERLLRLHLRWNVKIEASIRILGDAWERGYGDLEWRGIVADRILPWYFLTYDGISTHGYGVATGAASLAFWRIDNAGISLWLDVRNGARGVKLGDRALTAARIVSYVSDEEQSPFDAAHQFCRLMCPTPRLPDHVVYGGNNWYYAYGDSSHEQIIQDTQNLLNFTPAGGNKPYMVIDAGWQKLSTPKYSYCGGPWDSGNAAFPDMPGLASSMSKLGARPGVWVRPLCADPAAKSSLLLPIERARDGSAQVPTLDPSIAEVLDGIEADCRRINQWGYDLIKHDWTSCDIFGRWGFDFGSQLTNDGWAFADGSQTTAEITLNLYRAIRRGGGPAVVIGCNTIGHLAAGIFELQRTGDDTSGKEWERTRKMGVNTLAFRMPQHRAFFDVDADCVGLTLQVDWQRNRQWLDLLALSGTPLFVSADPKAMGSEQIIALREAFAIASLRRPVAEPLDWMGNTTPGRWRIDGAEKTFDWYGQGGVSVL
jgi:alpha-galactosidase